MWCHTPPASTATNPSTQCSSRTAVAANSASNRRSCRKTACSILSAKSIEAMFARAAGAAGHKENGDEKSVYYGCGWSVRSLGDQGRNTWHNGLLAGTSSLLVRRGKGDLTWAVLFNGH